MLKPSFKEQIQGFPLKQILVIGCVNMAEPITFTSIFPYCYFMIRDFDIAKDESEISKYAGYLASAFALSQIISAILWGRAADVYGRKPILITGLLGNLISLLLLGFAKNYWVALLARCLMGLLNGNSGVVRCVIGEIAPDKRHNALAFLVLPVAWNVGGIFGPWIGGSLSHPRKVEATGIINDPSFMNSLNSKYPYALPNIVIAGVMMIGIFITVFFLKETHSTFKHDQDRGLEIKDKFLGRLGWSSPTTPMPDVDGQDNEITSLISKESTIGPNEQKGKIPWSKILKPKVMNPIISYFIMIAHYVVFNEFLPIFVSYKPAYDSNGDLMSKLPLSLVGGLGYTAEKSGVLLSVSGFFGIVVMLLIFPWMDRTFDAYSHLRFALGLFPILFFILPYVLILLPNHVDPGQPMSTFWADVFLYIFTFVRVIFASTMTSTVMVLINTNAPRKFVGVVNGLSISASACAGCITPIVWGYLMTLSQQLDAAWLSWWCLSFLTLIGFIQGFFIREDPDIEDDPERTCEYS